jgi:hypothetical protein
MLSGDLQPVADQLAERAVIRAGSVDAWVSLALEQANPTEWANALVAAALEKLEGIPECLKVKAEAKLQIQEIRSAIHAGIVRTLLERRYSRSAKGDDLAPGETMRPGRSPLPGRSLRIAAG